MAKIYWRNGRAWARATVKGVEYREPLDTTSSREAEERFQLWLADLKQNNSKWSKGETTFSKAVDVFTDEHLPTLKKSSQDRYLLSLLTLTPHFEGKTLQGIGKADLMAFVSARRKEKVSDSTVRRDLACLSSVFTIAADWELCDANPVLPFLRTQKRRKKLVEPPPRDRYLSHADELQILQLAKARFDKSRVRISKPGAPINRLAVTRMMILAAIVVAIDTGLRDEEQLRLRWPQVDLSRSEVTVTASRAKNGKARTVPLLPRSLAILSALPRHPHTDLVFWHRDGTGFYDLNHTLQALASAVGVHGIRWHDLRRTCGCRLLQDHKLPMEQVSRWLGHSSVIITEKIYAFLNVDELHRSVGNIRTIDGTEDPRDTLARLVFIRKTDASS